MTKSRTVALSSIENTKKIDFPFASTRYYGSKRQQVSWIAERLLELGPSHVLDPMAGTGTVSHALSILGIPVTFGDAFAFNVKAGRGLFTMRPVDLGLLESFIDSVQPRRGTISRNFRGIFFTDAENSWLDGLMFAIQHADAGLEKDVLFYSLVQACLKKRPFNLFHRPNLYLRTANVSRSFGNAVTWETSFAAHMKVSLREAFYVRRSLVAPVVVKSARDVLAHTGKFDLVYLDPPYFRKQKFTETYLKRYHFLEGLAAYDTWEQKIDRSSPIRCFGGEHVPKEWASGADVLTGIRTAAERYVGATIVVSYVRDEDPSIDRIERALRGVRRWVSKTSIDTNTALSKDGRREVLIVATD